MLSIDTKVQFLKESLCWGKMTPQSFIVRKILHREHLRYHFFHCLTVRSLPLKKMVTGSYEEDWEGHQKDVG